MPTSDERIERLQRMRARGAARRRSGAHRAAAHVGQADRARAPRPPPRSRARSSSSTPSSRHRSTDFGLDEQHILGDGVVTGHGTIDGRLVFVFSQDFTVFGGSLSEAYAEKIVKVMDLAMKVGAPVVGLNDSGGARIQEGVASLAGYAWIFTAERARVGRRPADLGHHGPLRRRRGLLAGDHRLHDHGRGHELHVRHRAERREDRDPRGGRLRGPRRGDHAHDEVAALRISPRRDEATALDHARRILVVPAPEQPGRAAASSRRAIRSIARTRRSTRSCRTTRRSPTTCTTSSRRFVDDADFFEIQPDWAANIIVGFAHLGGRSVGIVAQQPAVLAGALDIESSVQGRPLRPHVRRASTSRWSRSSTCRGSCPASTRSTAGSSRKAPSCSTPIARRRCRRSPSSPARHTAARTTSCARKHVRGDMNFAWPTAEIAVMGAEGAVNIIFKDQIAKAADPVAERARLVAEYEAKFNHPYVAASRGWIDDVILPSETRPRLIAVAGDARRQARDQSAARSTATSRCDATGQAGLPWRLCAKTMPADRRRGGDG